MRPTTLKHLVQRANDSNVSPFDLGLAEYLNGTKVTTKFEIDVTYDGKDDEMVSLGETSYEVNVVDWIVENVREEAEKDGEASDRSVSWRVALYDVSNPEAPPIYVVDSRNA